MIGCRKATFCRFICEIMVLNEFDCWQASYIFLVDSKGFQERGDASELHDDVSGNEQVRMALPLIST